MKILIVYPQPDINKHPRFGFSYDMLTIATLLSKYHDVIIRDYSCEERNDIFFISFLQRNKIDLILVECDSYALKRSENLIHAEWIVKSCIDFVPVIAYGNYCYITKQNFSVASNTVFNNDINDVIKLVNFYCGQSLIPNIDNFDDLPFLDRSLLLNIDFYRNNKDSTLLKTSKGCNNSCVFCQRKGWQSHYISHSDEYILHELNLVKSQGYKNIWIADDNFSFNLSRSKNLMKKIIETKVTEGMSLFISSWANIDEEFLHLAFACNVKIISFGIESGNKDILSFYRKNINLDKIPQLIKLANNIGLFTVGNFIIGAPNESQKTINETFNLIRNCEFDQVNIKTLDYMIGSVLYENLEKSRKVSDHIFACKEFGLCNFSLEQIKKIKQDFLNCYYKEHKDVLRLKIAKFGLPFTSCSSTHC